MIRRQKTSGALFGAMLLALMAALTACSSAPSKPQAGPLPAVAGGMSVTRAWSYRLAESASPLQVAVNGTRLIMVSAQGVLAEVDADNGKELSRLDLKQGISAGVGSDGRRHAVVNTENELLVLQQGREIWRQRLSAQTHTPPLVAGERVFVLTADRTVQAFDGASGQRLWTAARTADPLVLRQAGALSALGDTLLAGNGGRLSAINPPQWPNALGGGHRQLPWNQ